MTPATAFAGRTVALFGLGGSGLATALALKAGGARVVACDDSAEAMAKAEGQGIGTGDLRTADWSRFAALVLSPGVPLTHPEPHWSVKLAQAAGVEVIGDIELFCREREKRAPDAPLIAITGTNGKSTTTALVAHILRELGNDVQMGGNIGTAILSLEPPSEARVHVIECSSFQIDLAPSLKPSVGVLLNVSPDHLDRHGTMENYAAIKSRLVLDALYAVVSIDDPWCQAIAERRLAGPRGGNGYWTRLVSLKERIDPGIVYSSHDGGVTESDLADKHYAGLAKLKGIRALRGEHNAQNAMAAMAAVLALSSCANEIHLNRAREAEGPFPPVETFEEVAAVLKERSRSSKGASVPRWRIRFPTEHPLFQRFVETFPGLPHRMEEVGRLGRAIFVNDSKATNADSTEKALSSFDRVLWILGGKPKEGGIESLRPYFPKVERAYLIGEAADAFAATLGDEVPYVHCGTLDRAVAEAAADAARSGAAEPVVLLSPACASYDQFRNFEERGNRFRDLVRALPESR